MAQEGGFVSASAAYVLKLYHLHLSSAKQSHRSQRWGRLHKVIAGNDKTIAAAKGKGNATKPAAKPGTPKAAPKKAKQSNGKNTKAINQSADDEDDEEGDTDEVDGQQDDSPLLKKRPRENDLADGERASKVKKEDVDAMGC